jgi:hypothetical protein
MFKFKLQNIKANFLMTKLIQKRYYYYYYFIIFSGSAAQRGPSAPSFTRFLDHTQRRATFGRTPLDE